MSNYYFSKKANQDQHTPADDGGAEAKLLAEQDVYTDEDLEGYVPYSTESSYYEKAQDFKRVIKILRINYLGLKPEQRTDDKGNINTVYVRRNNYVSGINDKGINACVRFLETRLGQHIILTKWDKERMYAIMLDDMKTWFYYMLSNMEAFQLDVSTFAELRILINDLLEATYSRAVGGEERSGFKPMATELKRVLGIGDNSEPKQNYPNPNVNIDGTSGNNY